MKTINVTLTDEEHVKLVLQKTKLELSWHDLLMYYSGLVGKEIDKVQ